VAATHSDEPAPSVADVVDVMERLYPPTLAADWDSIGLVLGDPDAPVRTILLSVDASEEASLEAHDRGADLLITHHPLFLSGVTSFAADSSKGRIVHRLIRHDIALFNAHTNADCADPGVSDALATALGLIDLEPLDDSGLGRVGQLTAPMMLSDFADHVAAALPFTPRGISVSGDLMSQVSRVAVCGGAGDSLLSAANASGADVYVTADLRHHRAFEHRADGGCFLIDVPHWASEWPWLKSAKRELRRALAQLPGGRGVIIEVSQECTDPWTTHRRSPDA